MVQEVDQEVEFLTLGPEVRLMITNYNYCDYSRLVTDVIFFLSCDGLDGGLGSGKVHSLPLSSVYTWGSGISMPLRLPMLNTEVLQVSLGRTQKMGVTKSGRLITWEVCVTSCVFNVFFFFLQCCFSNVLN